MKQTCLILCLTIFAFKANKSYSQNTVGLLEYSTASDEGYTLFAPVNSNYTYLIDNCGFEVHSWESEFRPGLMAYLMEDGTLLRAARISGQLVAGGSGGRVEMINWENELIWSYDFSTSIQNSHHDLAVLPNGNFLVLLWDLHSANEAIQMGKDTSFIPGSQTLWSEQIYEIKPVGTDQIEIVWEWNAWDHMIQDFDSEKENFGVIHDHPEKLNINFPFGLNSADWMHMNSIDYNPELDQICINSRNFNEFYIIDHSTTTEEAAGSTGGIYGKGGDILFRWGNPAAYNKGTPQDRKLFGQHDAQWIEKGFPGQGNIIVFNNGAGRPGNTLASTIEEIITDPDADGFYELNQEGTFGADESLWVYPQELTEDFFSGRISGTQRLSNGNTLIANGQEALIFEVDQNENVVWSYRNPVAFFGPIEQGEESFGSELFKVRRYSYDYPAFDGRDVSPIAQIELDPNPTDCLTTSLEDELNQIEYSIYPNPFTDNINIDFPTNSEYQVEIFNQIGQRLSCDKVSGSTEINIEANSKGIYLVKILDQKNKKTQTQTIIKL